VSIPLAAARHSEHVNSGESSNLIGALRSMADIHSLLDGGKCVKYAEGHIFLC
jgi:hypothetical protein